MDEERDRREVLHENWREVLSWWIDRRSLCPLANVLHRFRAFRSVWSEEQRRDGCPDPVQRRVLPLRRISIEARVRHRESNRILWRAENLDERNRISQKRELTACDLPICWLKIFSNVFSYIFCKCLWVTLRTLNERTTRTDEEKLVATEMSKTYVRSGSTIFLLADAAGVDLDFSIAMRYETSARTASRSAMMDCCWSDERLSE